MPPKQALNGHPSPYFWSALLSVPFPAKTYVSGAHSMGCPLRAVRHRCRLAASPDLVHTSLCASSRFVTCLARAAAVRWDGMAHSSTGHTLVVLLLMFMVAVAVRACSPPTP